MTVPEAARIGDGWELTWPAPAKLNLLLNIIGRRDDGYHLLQTLFQLLDLEDQLWFEPREDNRVVRVEGHPDIQPDEDLVVRAAEALRDTCGVSHGVSLRVKKNIPLGGGLGGGSSDAATTLVALNCLWELGLGDAALAEIGLGLGADVPVFVHGRSAWAEGIGDELKPVELPDRTYVILHPGCTISTARVFGDPELTRQGRPLTIRGPLDGPGVNTCENVVRRRYPEVARALDWLGQFGDASLTGTGSCVFAAVSDKARAGEILKAVPDGWTGYTARGINHSPLQRISSRLGHAGAG